ncbi:MAG: rhomboid family intramembrane serine protease [Gemmatimonadaceae bacterium]
MSYGLTDDQDRPRITPAVQALIAANVFIYFVQLTVVSEADMWGALAFQMKDLQRAWWTIGTYMFVHAGVWHLAVNMYTLWLFGPRVEHHWDSRSFTLYYLWCGVGGWLAHVLFVRDGFLLGASAAVLGVSLAYAMRWPDDEVLFFGFVPMKVKWLVVFTTLFNLVNGIWDATSGTGVSGTAYFAHLGGLVFGFFWLRTPPSQSVDRLRRRVAAVPDIPDETPRAVPRSLPRPRERQSEADEVVAKSKAVVMRRPTAADPGAPREQKVDALNTILDKISNTGLSSLTQQERGVLEELSKQLKGK